MASQGPVIGVIGGSGVYEIEGLTDAEWRTVETPRASSSLSNCMAFLPW